MENTNGFYKLDNTSLLYAPNKVTHKDYVLETVNKDTYTYPVEGWYWFDTKEEAETFFTPLGYEPEELMEG